MYRFRALYLDSISSGNSSVVEHLVANEKVASSNLVSRSTRLKPLQFTAEAFLFGRCTTLSMFLEL